MSNLSAKEKAKELVLKYEKCTLSYIEGGYSYYAKTAALIAVDREIKLINEIMDSYHGYQDIRTPFKLFKDVLNPLLKEKQEVKQEIEKYE